MDYSEPLIPLPDFKPDVKVRAKRGSIRAKVLALQEAYPATETSPGEWAVIVRVSTANDDQASANLMKVRGYLRSRWGSKGFEFEHEFLPDEQAAQIVGRCVPCDVNGNL